MKNKLSCLLVLLIGGSLSGMDAPPAEECASEGDIVCNPLVRLEVAERLFRLFPEKEAVEALINWALMNQESYGIFLDSGIQTTLLLKRILRSSYAYNRDEQLIAQSLRSLVSQSEYKVHAQNKALLDGFVNILKACSERQDWQEAFTALKTLQDNTALKDYFSFCLWKDDYLGSPARKAVVNYALELGAPKKLIKALIRWGTRLTDLPSQTPPPLLAVGKKITELKQPGNSERNTVSSAPLVELDEKGKDSLEELRALIPLLVKSGAKVTDNFINMNNANPATRSISSVGWAILKKDKETLELLLKGEKLFLPDEFALATICFLYEDSAEREELFRKVLGASKDIEKMFFRVIPYFQEFQTDSDIPNPIDRIIKVLSIIIDYGVDLNPPVSGWHTFLDFAYQFKLDEKIIDFLIEKGVKKSGIEVNDEGRKMQDCFNVCRDIFLRKTKGEQVSQEEICLLLKEAKRILPALAANIFDTPANLGANNPNEVWGSVLSQFVGLAMEVLSSPEAYEFFFFIETYRPLSVPFSMYGTVTSVFHWIVGACNLMKISQGEEAYSSALKGMSEGLSVLLAKFAQNGVKDDKKSEGKTAAERARALGMDELANLITNALNPA